MAAATINIKKADLKKALCAMKIKGIKAKNLVEISGELITEVDFKNPKDLYEVGLLQNTLTGSEFNVDELVNKLIPAKGK